MGAGWYFESCFRFISGHDPRGVTTFIRVLPVRYISVVRDVNGRLAWRCAGCVRAGSCARAAYARAARTCRLACVRGIVYALP